MTADEIADRILAEHEARLTVGAHVRIRLSTECAYCAEEAEALDGMTGVIESTVHDYLAGTNEPNWQQHHYWVVFDTPVPERYMDASHYTSCELIVLDGVAARS